MKKAFLAALLAAVLTAGTKVPASAAGTVYAESSDSSEMVTVYLETPIEMTYDESFVNVNPSSNPFSAMPMSLTELPRSMFGAYNASDGSSYIQINSGTDVTFRGSVASYGYVFCNGNLNNAYYDPAKSTNNFSVSYSSYYTYSKENYTYHNKSISIIGTYSSSNKTITVNAISYYFQ